MEYDRAPSFWDYTELTRFATSEDKELRATGILQLASKALPLALRAGGGNEEPVRDGDREQQCCDAFHQLPTCILSSERPRRESWNSSPKKDSPPSREKALVIEN